MTQMTYEEARARLLALGEQSFAELAVGLTQSHQRLLSAFAGVSETQARFKPPSGEGEEAWSIGEVLRHVIQATEGNATRIDRLSQGQPAQPSIPSSLGGHEGEAATKLVPVYEAAYGALLEVINGLTGQERLDTTATHAYFGELNCRAWLAMHVAHMSNHAGQMEKVKAAEGYPAA
jgi:hypothetical protein